MRILASVGSNIPGAEAVDIRSSCEAHAALWEVLADSAAKEWQVSLFADSFPLLVVIEEAADSQFDLLMQAFREGKELPASGAAIARRGTKFHGHHGRPWVAEQGNIHLTAWFSTALPLVEYQAALTMLPALAAWSAIKRCCPNAQPSIKWVNDILLEEKKVSGVITSTQSRGGIAERVVYGIGLNVAKAPPAAPTSYVPETGCLAEYGQPDMWPVLDVLLAELARWHQVLLDEGPSAIYQPYAAQSLIVGREVCVMNDPGDDTVIADGVVQAVNADLSLSIDGYDAPIRTGRVRLVH